MRYRIELADDLMYVVRKDDRDGAEAKIDEWAGEYGIDPRRAKRALRDLMRQM